MIRERGGREEVDGFERARCLTAAADQMMRTARRKTGHVIAARTRETLIGVGSIGLRGMERGSAGALEREAVRREEA